MWAGVYRGAGRVVLERVPVPDLRENEILLRGCARGSSVQIDPALLHYSEVSVRSTFQYTPHFVRQALETIARGDIKSADFVTDQISLNELPGFFQHMKNRNGDMKMAVVS
jgi:threonine dehydrogenase-like Zn-dependent dehydrogenase